MVFSQTMENMLPADAPASPAENEEERIASLNGVLKQWFSQHRELRCFVAIDPSQRDPVSDDADDKGSFASLQRSGVFIDHAAFPESCYPYLLELDLSTPAGLDALARSVRIAYEDRDPESMAEGLGQRVGGWMAGSATLAEVTAHWSRLLLQRDENGRACALRLFDSRAFALLWSVLSHAQQQSILGPVRAWHVLDACAGLSTHLASSDPRDPFVLSTEQWQQIRRHGAINRALALHARTCRRQPAPNEIQAAIAAAARADRYGLADRDDWVAFIGHALAWHPQFDLHPGVTQLLECRAEDNFYTSAIGRLLPGEIDDIRQGAWYRTPAASTPA